MQEAFAAHLGLQGAEIAMVGDSVHDLVAGRAAGMATVAVLTGVAGHDELAPLCRRGVAGYWPSDGLAGRLNLAQILLQILRVTCAS